MVDLLPQTVRTLEDYPWRDSDCAGLYQYLAHCVEEGHAPDTMEASGRANLEGWDFVGLVTGNVDLATSDGVLRGAEELRDRAVAARVRGMLDQAGAALASGEKPVRDVLAILEGECRRYAKRTTSSAARTLEEIVADALDPDRHDPAARLSTGLRDLDYMLDGGYSPGNLCVVGASPSMGKTTLAVNLAFNHVDQGKSVCLSTLEMTDVEIVESLAQTMLRAPLSLKQAVRGGSVPTMQSYDTAFGTLCKFPLAIFSAQQVPDLEAEIDRHEAQVGRACDVVVVDYLQLMDPHRKVDSRQQEVAVISRALKVLARDRKLAVILLSQLNRESKSRKTHQPLMSDLRDSGAIEQDADQVLLLHRPDYYVPAERPGICEIHVAKNRHGQTGMVEVYFDRERKAFENHD